MGLFAGKPVREPMVWHGPFVCCSQQEVRQAFMRYQQGKFPPTRVAWDYKCAAARPASSAADGGREQCARKKQNVVCLWRLLELLAARCRHCDFVVGSTVTQTRLCRQSRLCRTAGDELTPPYKYRPKFCGSKCKAV